MQILPYSSSTSSSSAAEDSAIQDLLEDIRGSFERQFDDEFEELTAQTAKAKSGGDQDAVDDDDDDFGGLEPSLDLLEDLPVEVAAEAAAEASFQVRKTEDRQLSCPFLASSGEQAILLTTTIEVFLSFIQAASSPQTMQHQQQMIQQQQGFGLSHPHGPSMAAPDPSTQQVCDCKAVLMSF